MAKTQGKLLFAGDDFPIVGFDGGNERAKTSVILSKNLRNVDPEDEGSFFRNAIQMNAVAEISKQTYEQNLSRQRGLRPNYSFLHLQNKIGRKIEDFFFVIGDAAVPFIRDVANQRKMNKSKYVRHYHGVQLIRGLTVVYKGDLPSDIHVIAGHPPLNVEKTQDIIEALEGEWKLDFMGEEQILNVHTVKPIDEILGAAMNLRLKVDGSENGRASTLNRGTSLGFDLGGGTLDTMKINEKGFPIDGTFNSATVGIFDAILNFKAAFDGSPEYVKALGQSSQGVSLEDVYSVFRDKEHKLRGGGLEGGELDCKSLYEEVMNGELNRIYAMTSSLVDSLATAAKQVFIFGGAGDLLFEDLSETIFPRYADNGRLFRGGGILGASIGLAKFGQMLRRVEARKAQERA